MPLTIPSYVSPRQRAQRTLELLNLRSKHALPWKAHGTQCDGLACDARIEVTEDIREWDYGDYEGITTRQTRELLKQQGLDTNWDIWRDGCPGGEYVVTPHPLTNRVPCQRV